MEVPPPLVDVMIFDHTLVTVSVCHVKTDATTPATIEGHIIANVMAMYRKWVRKTNLMILVEDGTKCFKPSVREARDAHEDCTVMKYYKANRGKIMDLLIGTLEQLDVDMVRIKGTAPGRGMKYRRIGACSRSDKYGTPNEKYPGGPFPELNLDTFVNNCHESESDTVMFAFARHCRSIPAFEHSLIAVFSKDSDIVGTAMALEINQPSVIGDTLLAFHNPIFTYNKDFDVGVGDHKWADPGDDHTEGGVYPKRLKYTNLFPGDAMWDLPADDDTLSNWHLLYDTETLRVFRADIDQYNKSTLFGNIPGPSTKTGFRKMMHYGFRGAIFRRLMLRLLSDQDEVREATLSLLQSFPSIGTFTIKLRNEARRTLGEFFKNTLQVDDKLFTNSYTKNHVANTLTLSNKYFKGEIPSGTYGRFIERNNRDSPVHYIRVFNRGHLPAIVTLCILAGTDYNLPLHRLGIAEIVKLFSCLKMKEICRDIFLPERQLVPGDCMQQKVATMRNICQVAGIGIGAAASRASCDSYLSCVWRTLCYTYHTWCLKCPVPSEDYGYIDRIDSVTGEKTVGFTFEPNPVFIRMITGTLVHGSL